MIKGQFGAHKKAQTIEFWFNRYWWIELMRLFSRKQNGRQLKCTCQESCYLKSWNQGCKHRGPWTECRQCQHEEKWADRQEKKEEVNLASWGEPVLSFIISLFCVIQVSTSETHVCMVKSVACIWSGGQVWGSCVSQQKTGWRQKWVPKSRS